MAEDKSKQLSILNATSIVNKIAVGDVQLFGDLYDKDGNKISISLDVEEVEIKNKLLNTYPTCYSYGRLCIFDCVISNVSEGTTICTIKKPIKEQHFSAASKHGNPESAYTDYMLILDEDGNLKVDVSATGTAYVHFSYLSAE